MNHRTQLVMVIGALLTIAACDTRAPGAPGNLPTERPRGAADPGLPPIFAEVDLRSISLEPGSTLTLRGCGNDEGFYGAAYCTDELQTVFTVTADRDLASVALRIHFMHEGQRCALALTSGTPLSAHVPASVGATLTSYFVAMDGPGAPRGSGCGAPPVSTTVLIAELVDYSQSDAGDSVMTRSFPYSYRFVVPSNFIF